MGLHRATPAAPGRCLRQPQRKSRTPAFSFRERGKHEHRNYGLREKAYRGEEPEHYHQHTEDYAPHTIYAG
jgi:hypothetical protein